ncbi:MAG: hypothetical protein P8M25_00770, partial [Paracoccaceae bacterium]|nr:hypothetical protein [Paracoccaceae bacterium]
MLNFKNFSLLSMSFLILSITEALANVTAQQVWSDLHQKLTSNGFQISATKFSRDGVLIIRDLLVKLELPLEGADGFGSISLALETLQFVDKLDGTVKLMLPNIMPITLTLKDPEAGAVDLQLDLTQSGLEMSVSGHDQDRRYHYAAQSLDLELRKLLLDGIELSETDANAVLKFTMIRGSSIQREGTLHHLNQVLSIDEVTYQANIAVPYTPDTATHFSGKLSNLSFTSNTLLPLSLPWKNPLEFIASGAQGDGSWQSSASQSTFSTFENGDKLEYSSKTAAKSGTVALNKDRLLYHGESTGLEMFLLLDRLPFPISV